MIELIYILLGVFGLSFLEGLMFGLGLMSVVVIMSLFVYERLDPWKYLTLFLPISVGIESVNDLFLGSYFSAILVATLLYNVLKRVIPTELVYIEAVTAFLSFFLFHTWLEGFSQLQINFSLNFIDSSFFLTAARFALLETVVLLLIQYVVRRFFSTKGSNLKI